MRIEHHERSGERRRERAPGPRPLESVVGGVGAGNLTVIDPSAALVELLTARFEADGHQVTGCTDPAEAVRRAEVSSTTPPDLIVVEASFPRSELNGLDVMLSFGRWCPETAMLIYTNGAGDSAKVLTVAWESVRPAAAVSKLSPLSLLVETVDAILRTGRAPSDPSLSPLLPSDRSPWRTADGYSRLVPHAGHAKLWRALLSSTRPPSYKEIAAASRLSTNTIRNYRDDLLGELRLHGLDNPTMRQIHEFAHSIRPLIQPVLDERLAPAAAG